MLTDSEAFLRLARMTAMDEEPVLTDQDLLRLLADNTRGSVWAAATAYTFGAVVVPATRNGRRFIAAVAGTTDATEPDWVTSDFAQTVDGTVTWEEAGLDFTDGWDLDAAAHQAWLEKAAIAASAHQFADAQQTFYRQQLIEHCERMAGRYAPVRVV